MRSSWISHSLNRFAMQSHCQIFVKEDGKREETVPAEALTIKICSLIMVTSLISELVSSSVDLQQQFFVTVEEKDGRDKRLY